MQFIGFNENLQSQIFKKYIAIWDLALCKQCGGAWHENIMMCPHHIWASRWGRQSSAAAADWQTGIARSPAAKEEERHASLCLWAWRPVAGEGPDQPRGHSTPPYSLWRRGKTVRTDATEKLENMSQLSSALTMKILKMCFKTIMTPKHESSKSKTSCMLPKYLMSHKTYFNETK